MKFSAFQRDLKTAAKAQVILSLLCAVLILSNLFLVIFAIHQSKKAWVLVVPPVMSVPFKINQLEVDSNYLQEMSLFFLSERLNVSPETVSQNHSLLLKFIAPDYYSDIENALKKEEKSIQAGKISSAFFVKKINLSPESLSASVEGSLSVWSGHQFISEEPKSYTFQYIYENGRLLIKTFSENVNEK